MKNRTKPEFVVMSGCLKGLPELKNMQRHAQMRSEIADLGFYHYYSGTGNYQGDTEESLLIVLKDRDELKLLQSISVDDGQECILFVDYQRDGFLLFPNGEKTYVGQWKEVENADHDFSIFEGSFYKCV